MARVWLRDPNKEKLWRARLSAWRQSGLDGRAFCRRQGLSEHSFYGWKREIARRDREAAAAKPAAAKPAAAKPAAAKSRAAKRQADSSSSFVPVHVLAELAEAMSVIDILMPDQIVVRVGRGIDRSSLRDVLAALAEVRAEAQSAAAQSAGAQSPEGRPC